MYNFLKGALSVPRVYSKCRLWLWAMATRWQHHIRELKYREVLLSRVTIRFWFDMTLALRIPDSQRMRGRDAAFSRRLCYINNISFP